MPTATEQQLEQRFSQTIQLLHGLAASIADSKQRYAETGDERYVTAVANVYPFYQEQMAIAQDIARQLANEEMPSSLLLTLSSTSDWLVARGRQVGEGITDTIAQAPTLLKYVAIAAVVISLAYITGQLAPLARTVKGK
jgi:hypothetical protein